MVTGFNALEEAASLNLEGYGLDVIQPQGVFANLTKIQGNVEISIKADQPYGTGQIQTIGGNLRFKDTTIIDLSAFASLQLVAGCITFEEASKLSEEQQEALLSKLGKTTNSNVCL